MVTFEFGVNEIVLFTANEPMFDLERLKILTSNEIFDRQRGDAAAAAADNNPKIHSRGTNDEQAENACIHNMK